MDVAATLSALSGAAMAADYKQNPFTLTYEGAITENAKGKVNIHPVTYKLNGIDISANVYTPANYDASKKYPALVVAHPGPQHERRAGLHDLREDPEGRQDHARLDLLDDLVGDPGLGGDPLDETVVGLWRVPRA